MLSVFCLSGQCRAEPQRKLKHKHPVLTKCCLLDKSTYSVLSLILLYVCSARDAVFDPLAECVVAAEDSVKCAETLAGLQTAQCDRINRTNSGCLFRRAENFLICVTWRLTRVQLQKSGSRLTQLCQVHMRVTGCVCFFSLYNSMVDV